MEANPNNSSEQIEIDWKSNMILFPISAIFPISPTKDTL